MTDSECKAIEQSCLENVRAALKLITSAGICNADGFLTEDGAKALEELEGLDLYWICDPAIKLAKSATTGAEKSAKGDLISREDLKIEVEKQIAYCDDRSKHQSDLNEVLRYVNTAYGLRLAHICIDNALAVYPERPKGGWINLMETQGYVVCPYCGKEITGGDLNFCVKCGADMRGKDKSLCNTCVYGHSCNRSDKGISWANHSVCYGYVKDENVGGAAE